MRAVTTIPTSEPAVPHSRRSVWAPAAAVGVLLLTGILVAMLVARNERATVYPANSPVGTVQRYVRLLQNGKLTAAYAMVYTSEGESEFDSEYGDWSSRSHQVTLVSTDRQRATASVTIEISGVDAGPFGASNSSQRVTFHLDQHGRGWIITDPPYLPG